MFRTKDTKPEIETYRGFGSPQKIVIVGRVHTQTKQDLQQDLSPWHHARYIVGEYITKPVRNHTVYAAIGKTKASSQTNDAGMFYITIDNPELEQAHTSEWYEATVWTANNPEHVVPASVLIEGRGNSYGIISDIDDTVLISGATNKIKLLYTTFFKRITSRKLFDNTVELYRALAGGTSGKDTNPVFYISSSHWSLYYLLTIIFTVNKLPEGPLLLKEVPSIWRALRNVGSHSHKQMKIQTVLDAYPTLSFILVGDSGQRDADIYREIVSLYGDRIRAVYIRDVTPHLADAINELPETSHTEWFVSPSSQAIQQHAQRIGLLP